MTRTIPYLICLSEKTIEKVMELEKLWGIDRDEAIATAIEFTYEERHPLSKTQMDEYKRKKFFQSLGEAAQQAASSFIITIEPVKKE